MTVTDIAGIVMLAVTPLDTSKLAFDEAGLVALTV
jgi:hypothetical protein